MPRPFPSQPNLEHFRKQSKQLLRDIRAGNSDAARRASFAHPRWSAAADVQRGFSLHDAQLVLAREFGFSSWRRLVDAIERRQQDRGPSHHVVITGGAGFIGSHLAERLLTQGHRVTAFDDLSTGSRDNVAHLLEDPHFELHVADVVDADAVDAVVAEADVLFHLATSFGHDVGAENCLHANVHGTKVVLESASRHGVRLLFTSTSAVYGDLTPGAMLREDDGCFVGSPTSYGWDYALSKIACEQLLFDHVERHDLRATSVRLFNVVGARQTSHAVPTFLRQAQQGQAITVHGDGLQSRCFTDVRDTVEGLVRLADCDEAAGETVNIGSRQVVTVRQLAQQVKIATGSDSTIENVPYDFDMVPSRVPCLSKARQLIGYAAVHPVEQSLREILDLGGDNNHTILD
jgi:UDP-glucose 4-epimerase